MTAVPSQAARTRPHSKEFAALVSPTLTCVQAERLYRQLLADIEKSKQRQLSADAAVERLLSIIGRLTRNVFPRSLAGLVAEQAALDYEGGKDSELIAMRQSWPQ